MIKKINGGHMNQVIDQEVRTAVKQCECDLCGGSISKGEKYHWLKCAYDGEIYTWKEHLKCQFIASAICEYVNPNEGMDEEIFSDGCAEICQKFICPACANFEQEDNECAEGEPYCLGKLYDFLKANELYKADSGIWRYRDRANINL